MAEAAENLQLTVEPVSVALGARVEGVDLAHDRGPDTIAELRDLLLEHHLLVLPNQHLTALELEAFGRSWGDLLTHPATRHRDTDYVQFIGGKGGKGGQGGGKERRFRFFPGGASVRRRLALGHDLASHAADHHGPPRPAPAVERRRHGIRQSARRLRDLGP